LLGKGNFSFDLKSKKSKEIMSWQAYVDQNLVGTAKVRVAGRQTLHGMKHFKLALMHCNANSNGHLMSSTGSKGRHSWSRWIPMGYIQGIQCKLQK
jgi:hypothetical protein